MHFLIGAVITVALVLMLIWAVQRPTLDELKDRRIPAHILLLCVPALVLPSDVWAIATLAGSSMALFEVALVLLAL